MNHRQEEQSGPDGGVSYPFGLMQQQYSRQREDPQVQRPQGGKALGMLKNMEEITVGGIW